MRDRKNIFNLRQDRRHLVIDVSGHGRAEGEGHGAEREQEADGLARARRAAQVERDGAQHRDEAAVEYSWD